MTRQEALPLRFFLGLWTVAALLVQVVVIPRAGSSVAGAYPEVAHLAPPTIAVLIIAVIGFELAIVAAWYLVSIAVASKALTGEARRWADVIAASLTGMAVLGAGVCAYMGFVANIGGPAMLFGLLASLALIPIAVALRAWVMNWFDRSASARSSGLPVLPTIA
ncbi:DUF2975 domain-containing protein [Arthrobacter echini]|uniref:DUF2975 domain-containing protein n=1 Tax=Arthrobacter echini TaxID=1529066 RepID=A0A5D0XUZ9_9MICC|nr:DUF2975 domain-containing protein [Arthrobacter echini]TYD00605.1 DUF2975 domain-containing protein [Arthrobacter echini]